MATCTRWWVRRYLNCQAREPSCHIIRWPTLSVPLPEIPDVSVSVDYFGPLPTKERGNSYILFTDRFSRSANIIAVTAAEFTVEGTANILVNRSIPFGVSHSPTSPTMAPNSARNYPPTFINSLVSANSPRVRITRAVTAESSASTTRWSK